MRHLRLTPWRAAAATLLYVVLWQAATHGSPDAHFRATAGSFGLAGLYALGIGWLVWGLERAAQRIDARRRRPRSAAEELTGRRAPGVVRSWDPLDVEAWYYGRHSQRFRQSLLALSVYSFLFVGTYFGLQLLDFRPAGIVEQFELPGGGGSDSPAGAPQVVRVQKVQKKRFVINPYSSIVFNVPEIDKVQVDMLKDTRNEYQAGQTGLGGEGGGTGDGTGGFGSGTGTGGGFGVGTGTGRLRFIRLKHSDRSWDKNFGIGGDQNLWLEFATWSRIPASKIAEKTEYVDFVQLAAFKDQSAPPFLFVTGAHEFNPTPNEKRLLKQYLLERHGMIFADNLGGRNFHNQFFAVMREVTGAQEVAIPRDDLIHRRPFPMPTLPIVVAHGGTVPYGWNVDGRWVVYYHPGAISDAWRDDHAGIKREVWAECNRLGINVMAYAFLEYAKWQKSLRPEK